MFDSFLRFKMTQIESDKYRKFYFLLNYCDIVNESYLLALGVHLFPFQ